MQKHAVRRQRFYTLALMLAGSLVVLMAMPRLSLALRLPKDLTFTETDGQPAVVFSHQKHVGEQKLKCTECHIKLFQMKAGKTTKKFGKLTMKAMREEGKFCGACHNGKRAFAQSEDNCVKCHVKK